MVALEVALEVAKVWLVALEVALEVAKVWLLVVTVASTLFSSALFYSVPLGVAGCVCSTSLMADADSDSTLDSSILRPVDASYVSNTLASNFFLVPSVSFSANVLASDTISLSLSDTISMNLFFSYSDTRSFYWSSCSCSATILTSAMASACRKLSESD